MHEIVLVTPVWNDSQRLADFGFELAEALNQSELSVCWVIADDGSCASEKQALEALARRLREVFQPIQLVHLAERTRKGGAVYAGWDAVPEAKWLAYVDADGAVSAETVCGFLAETCANPAESGAVGVRADTGSVQRSLFRRLNFAGFRCLVHGIVFNAYQDTQCGLKVIRAEDFRRVKSLLCETGYLFDVELLLALQRSGVVLAECPIPWRERAGSKIKILQDATRMLAGLFRIRRRDRAGGYQL